MMGLWKGNLSAEYLYLTYGAVQFFLYHEIHRLLEDPSIRLQDDIRTMVAGGLAGSIATVVTYPFDLLRTRFAVQSTKIPIYTSLFDAVSQIATKEGYRAFYRGVWPSTVQIGPYMAVMFESQRLFKKAFGMVKDLPRLREAGITWGTRTDEFMAGGCAGIVSKAAVMPFDVVRKRLQVQGPDRTNFILDIPRYKGGLFACASQIVKYEGVFALYKGLIPGLLKAGSSSAVTFFVVSECRKAFATWNRP